MQFTAVDGQFAHMLGGGGALMLSNFWVGGYGLGTTNHIGIDSIKGDPNDHLSISHGGFWVGYSLFGDKAIHVSISSLIGWGSVSINDDNGEYASDGLFVVVPTLEVEFNLTQFFRISAGATYNLFSFVDLIPDGGSGYTGSSVTLSRMFLSTQQPQLINVYPILR